MYDGCSTDPHPDEDQKVSALYLIDRHASPLASATILDIQESTQPNLAGRFVVKVPDGIPISNPTVVGDASTPGTLIYEKAAGYLLFYAGFTRVTTDDLLDASNIDSATSIGCLVGSRSAIVLEPGGFFQSLPVTLTAPNAMSAFITWDTFNYVEADSTSALYSRQYNELPSVPSNVVCNVSFNGGGTFNPAFDSAYQNINLPDQGSSFIIQLQNATTSRLSLGSWSVIY